MNVVQNLPALPFATSLTPTGVLPIPTPEAAAAHLKLNAGPAAVPKGPGVTSSPVTPVPATPDAGTSKAGIVPLDEHTKVQQTSGGEGAVLPGGAVRRTGDQGISPGVGGQNPGVVDVSSEKDSASDLEGRADRPPISGSVQAGGRGVLGAVGNVSPAATTAQTAQVAPADLPKKPTPALPVANRHASAAGSW